MSLQPLEASKWGAVDPIFHNIIEFTVDSGLQEDPKATYHHVIGKTISCVGELLDTMVVEESKKSIQLIATSQASIRAVVERRFQGIGQERIEQGLQKADFPSRTVMQTFHTALKLFSEEKQHRPMINALLVIKETSPNDLDPALQLLKPHLLSPETFESPARLSLIESLITNGLKDALLAAGINVSLLKLPSLAEQATVDKDLSGIIEVLSKINELTPQTIAEIEAQCPALHQHLKAIPYKIYAVLDTSYLQVIGREKQMQLASLGSLLESVPKLFSDDPIQLKFEMDTSGDLEMAQKLAASFADSNTEGLLFNPDNENCG